MNLTTKERVKALMNVSGTSTDTQIESLIGSVSVTMERYMGRTVQTVTRGVAKVKMTWGETMVPLTAYPVTALTTVRNSPTPDFTGRPYLVAGTDFYLDESAGFLQILSEPEFRTHPETGRPIAPTWFEVAYTGGMAADTAAFIAAYADIAGACDLQVRYLIQRQDSLGSSAELGGSVASFEGAYNWLPSVKQVLDYHRRGL